jgi:hypothetical protein
VIKALNELGENAAEALRFWEHRQRAERLTGWLRRIPIVGQLVHAFWYCLLDEGIVETMKPRWGALTFAFLNDGMKPTLWHTWRQITHDSTDPYTGIYPDGAPASLAEAKSKRPGLGGGMKYE